MGLTWVVKNIKDLRFTSTSVFLVTVTSCLAFIELGRCAPVYIPVSGSEIQPPVLQKHSKLKLREISSKIINPVVWHLSPVSRNSPPPQQPSFNLMRRNARFLISSVLNHQSCFAKIVCALGTKTPSTDTSILNDYAYLIGEVILDQGEDKNQQNEKTSEQKLYSKFSKKNKNEAEENANSEQSEEYDLADDENQNSSAWGDNVIDPEFIEWMVHADLAKTDPQFFKQVMNSRQTQRRKITASRSHFMKHRLKPIFSQRFSDTSSTVYGQKRNQRFESERDLSSQLSYAKGSGQTIEDPRKCTQIFTDQCPYDENQIDEIVIKLRKLLQGEQLLDIKNKNPGGSNTNTKTKKANNSLTKPMVSEKNMEIVIHLNQNLAIPFPSGFSTIYSPPYTSSAFRPSNSLNSSETLSQFLNYTSTPTQMHFASTNSIITGNLEYPCTSTTAPPSTTSIKTSEDRFNQLIHFLHTVRYLEKSPTSTSNHSVPLKSNTDKPLLNKNINNYDTISSEDSDENNNSDERIAYNHIGYEPDSASEEDNNNYDVQNDGDSDEEEVNETEYTIIHNKSTTDYHNTPQSKSGAVINAFFAIGNKTMKPAPTSSKSAASLVTKIKISPIAKEFLKVANIITSSIHSNELEQKYKRKKQNLINKGMIRKGTKKGLRFQTPSTESSNEGDDQYEGSNKEIDVDEHRRVIRYFPVQNYRHPRQQGIFSIMQHASKPQSLLSNLVHSFTSIFRVKKYVPYHH